MQISVFDLLKIGLGPSSSHTVGPMWAANMFIKSLGDLQVFNSNKLNRVQIDLYGSLALTGKGHGTDKAILMGLEGDTPNQIDVSQINKRFSSIKQNNILNLN